MIPVEQIHIGTRLLTNRGNIITVDSISTKRSHRKVGYHLPDDPYHIKYVCLAQCKEIVETPITPELLEANGWVVIRYITIPELDELDVKLPDFAHMRQGNIYAEYNFDRTSLALWPEGGEDDVHADLYLRICPTAEKLSAAFALANIDYKLKTE